ncbi:hypothetical protein SAMN04488557_2488 [Hyphomicrobium facile]|uniref:Uncharacterized protein n=1 Tax=Hyphomicrobium facile TaxID=51670 RepID=A0A1I7NKE8_9HYPH|nr:hypothetical protein SAMN04488557_2488 [Hyphomicrobium facile]
MGIRACYRLSAAGDPDDGPDGSLYPSPAASRLRDLPYRVELWDPAKATVELVLAMTVSGSIGYAAYHAATVEFPDRYIVLRHNDAVLSRWNAPTH